MQMVIQQFMKRHWRRQKELNNILARLVKVRQTEKGLQSAYIAVEHWDEDIPRQKKMDFIKNK